MNYLQYTNIVLQAINEVPLTQSNFGAARGLQQFAKDALLRGYLDIIGRAKWPWMMRSTVGNLGDLEVSGEHSMDVLDQWTAIPVADPYKDVIDWSSVYFRDSAGKKHNLEVIDWDLFEDGQDYFDREEEFPRWIVQSADGQSMGVFPYEDGVTAGKLYYRIWTRPSIYSAYDDVVQLPDIHYGVLVDAALQHLWSFRGNTDQSQLAGTRYEAAVKDMKIKYSNQTPRMRWA